MRRGYVWARSARAVDQYSDIDSSASPAAGAEDSDLEHDPAQSLTGFAADARIDADAVPSPDAQSSQLEDSDTEHDTAALSASSIADGESTIDAVPATDTQSSRSEEAESEHDSEFADSDEESLVDSVSESRSYSWLAQILFFYCFHLATPRWSFRVVPQGKITGSGSQDAPDFVFVIVGDEIVEIPLGWSEVKPEDTRGETLETFHASFVKSFEQMLRYTTRTFNSRHYQGVKRIRSLFSCGERFALIEWHRPGVLELDDESNIVNWPEGVPCWVKDHESEYFVLRDEQFSDLKQTSGYNEAHEVLLANPDSNESHIHELRREFRMCKETLSQMETYSPMIIMFGEHIFRSSGSNEFSPSFRHALKLLFTPLNNAISPPWGNLIGSVFEHDDSSFRPQTRHLVSSGLTLKVNFSLNTELGYWSTGSRRRAREAL